MLVQRALLELTAGWRWTGTRGEAFMPCRYSYPVLWLVDHLCAHHHLYVSRSTAQSMPCLAGGREKGSGKDRRLRRAMMSALRTAFIAEYKCHTDLLPVSSGFTEVPPTFGWPWAVGGTLHASERLHETSKSAIRGLSTFNIRGKE